MKFYKFSSLIVLGVLLLYTDKLYANQSQTKLASSDEDLRKIFTQGKIINEGQNYLRSLLFENALAKYEEALQPNILESNRSAAYPLGLKIACLWYQGRYEEALKANRWYFEKKLVKNVMIDDEKKLKAVVEWKNSENKQTVYEYIKYVQKKYTHWLPPKKLVPTSASIFSNLAEIYDLIGDYEGGISWAKSFKKTTKGKRDKQEYQNVIKAFEESKRGMPKICGDEGRTCVGRATAYIIQSDQL